MGTLTPDRDLGHPVQLAQTAGIRHQRPAPHHGADPKQPDLDLHDFGRCGTGDAGLGSALALGCFEGLGTSQPNRASPYSVVGTTHFLMIPEEA